MGLLDLLRPVASRSRLLGRVDAPERIADLPRSERRQSTTLDNSAVAAALQQLVALDMYRQGLPLAHVKAADTTGVVAAAIEALAVEQMAADLVAGVQDQVKSAVDDRPAVLTDTFMDHAADVVFYDYVRRAALASGIPCDSGTDLDKLAEQCGWDREHMAELVEGLEG